MLIEIPKIGFDDQLPLENHLIHHRHKRDYTVSGSISGTGNHQQDGAKLLENIGVLNIDWSLSRWDSKHRYKFLDFIWPGKKFLELSKKYTVSVATQSSLEKLHSIVDMSRHWTGPISLAVFVAGEEFRLTVLYISYLRRCFPHVKDQISFHLVFSLDYPPIDALNLQLHYKEDCRNPEALLSDLLKYRSPRTIVWNNNIPYAKSSLYKLPQKLYLLHRCGHNPMYWNGR
jgi:hypothetical protein